MVAVVAVVPRTRYRRLSAAPPPNGFGGMLERLPAVGALAAGLVSADAAFTLVGAGDVAPEDASGSATGAGTGAGTGASGIGRAAVVRAAGPLLTVFAARGGSSLAPSRMTPDVPTTTQTPRSTKHTRRPRLAGGISARDGERVGGRGAGTAEGLKT